MKVFAILHEPASYTVDRNKAIYDQLGVSYEYMHKGSYASESDVESAVLPVKLGGLVKRLRQILAENDVVIINGYSNKIFIILFLLNIFYRKPIGIDSDTQLSIPSNPIKRLLKWLYLRIIFGNSSVYGLAGGTGSHRELFSHYGMDKERIFLMPMVVDNKQFIKDNSIAHDIFTFLFVGRIIECKNLDILLSAFAEKFSNRSNVYLDVVGDGPLLPYLKKQYCEYKNILFSGKCISNSLVAKYHSADVFILPSISEQWGLVVNEAMAARLPVIVSDQVGAAHDLVEGKETGFVFKWNDVDDLQRKMCAMYENRDMCKRFATNASKLMHEYWNYDLYRNCLVDFLDYATNKKAY